MRVHGELVQAAAYTVGQQVSRKVCQLVGEYAACTAGVKYNPHDKLDISQPHRCAGNIILMNVLFGQPVVTYIRTLPAHVIAGLVGRGKLQDASCNELVVQALLRTVDAGLAQM